MVEITKKTYVTVSLEPQEMGVEFANMDARQQGLFWLGVAVASNKWATPLSFQWAAMAGELLKYPEALSTFMGMAEFVLEVQGSAKPFKDYNLLGQGPGEWFYQGETGIWHIKDNGKPAPFTAQHDGITGDGDPAWMFAEGPSLELVVADIKLQEAEHLEEEGEISTKSPTSQELTEAELKGRREALTRVHNRLVARSPANAPMFNVTPSGHREWNAETVGYSKGYYAALNTVADMLEEANNED